MKIFFGPSFAAPPWVEPLTLAYTAMPQALMVLSET